MQNPDESIQNFCREIVNYLTNSRQESPIVSEDIKNQISSEALTLIKKTQIKVSKEIQKRVDDRKEEDKLLNLYVIDRTLYQLHHKVNQAENIVSTHLCKNIKRTLNLHIKQINKKRALAESRFQDRVKWKNRIRVLCYIVGTICAFAGFAYPENVMIYLSITLICLTQIFLLGDFWINGEKRKRDDLFRCNNPNIANSALKFLTPENLIALLEPPSFAPEYHEQYFQMLVNLALSYGWMPNTTIDIEDLIENGKAALEDAYSMHPTTFDPKFIQKWRKTFEEIQSGLHHLFGDSLYSFNKKSHQDTLFYLEQYSAFKPSDLGIKLKKFLRQTEFL